MPPIDFPPPSKLINCTNLANCFQALYNFGFTIFLALAFIYFLYGAFQYLLSGAGIFKTEEGKKKMQNAIIALVVVLIIPVILNFINPGIFNVTLKIPEVTVTPSGFVIDLNAVENSERDLTDEEISSRMSKPPGRTALSRLNLNACKPSSPGACASENCNFRKLSQERKLTNISLRGDDCGTEYVNPGIMDMIESLDNKLRENGIKLILTDGYSPGDHKSKAHTQYGTAIDVVVYGNYEKWNKAIQIARSVGFCVLDERFHPGSTKWTGAHLHLQAYPCP